MRKKFKIVVSALILTAFLVGPSAASADGSGKPWPACGSKPCYAN